MTFKKTQISAVLAMMAALSGTAQAQSSVTLYGVIDAGVDYISNQRASNAPNARSGRTFSIQSGNLNTNRWGLRGTEDLGGGLAAIFNLENGFTVGNGAFANGGDEFGRLAYVGLSSKQYGQITLGRQYDDVVQFIAPFSATAIGFAGNLAAHPFDNDGLSNNVHMNNAVMFHSRDYNGLRFGGGYAFSNSTDFQRNRAFTFGGSYERGPLGVAAAFFQASEPGRATANSFAVGALTQSDGDTRFVGGRERVYAGAIHYDFGKTVVGLVATRTSVDDPVAIAASNGGYTPMGGHWLTLYNYEVNARYALTPALQLGAAYTYTQGHLSSPTERAVPKWHQVTIQSVYSISKQTDVYLEASFQQLVDGSDSPLATAGIFTFARSANNRQAVVAAGIRTRF